MESPQPQWNNPRSSLPPRRRLFSAVNLALVVCAVAVLTGVVWAIAALGPSHKAEDVSAGLPRIRQGDEQIPVSRQHPATFGKDTVTFENGLQITPSAPKEFKPTPDMTGTGRINYAIELKIHNSGEKARFVNETRVEWKVDGKPVERIERPEDPLEQEVVSVSPGETVTLRFGFPSQEVPHTVTADIRINTATDAPYTYSFGR